VDEVVQEQHLHTDILSSVTNWALLIWQCCDRMPLFLNSFFLLFLGSGGVFFGFLIMSSLCWYTLGKWNVSASRSTYTW
jgi:hypothetical protein